MPSSLTLHPSTLRKLASATALTLTALAAPAAHAMFNLEQLKRGISEEDAQRTVATRGWVVEAMKGEADARIVRLKASGDVKAQYWVCKGKVHAASTLQEGGLYAFMDRAAELSKAHGKGETTSVTQTVATGVVRTMETSFKQGDDVVKITYTPKGGGRIESFWQQSAATGLCN
jgi:hypothetical protein